MVTNLKETFWLRNYIFTGTAGDKRGLKLSAGDWFWSYFPYEKQEYTNKL
jgi:hypothetical protein